MLIIKVGAFVLHPEVPSFMKLFSFGLFKASCGLDSRLCSHRSAFQKNSPRLQLLQIDFAGAVHVDLHENVLSNLWPHSAPDQLVPGLEGLHLTLLLFHLLHNRNFLRDGVCCLNFSCQSFSTVGMVLRIDIASECLSSSEKVSTANSEEFLRSVNILQKSGRPANLKQL